MAGYHFEALEQLTSSFRFFSAFQEKKSVRTILLPTSSLSLSVSLLSLCVFTHVYLWVGVQAHVCESQCSMFFFINVELTSLRQSFTNPDTY